jgi:hypothetical protein
MLIPDPDFVYPGSRIQDPKTEERGEIKIRCPTLFFVTTVITKLEIILFLNW